MTDRRDHDAGYRELFSHPELVRDLIRGFIPDPWLQSLDFSTLQKVSGHYVTEDHRLRSDDVVWRVRVDETWLYLYLLIEFQSTIWRMNRGCDACSRPGFRRRSCGAATTLS